MNGPPWTEADAAEEDLANSHRKRQRLRPKSIVDVVSAPPPVWRILRLLPERGLAVLYGDSGCGKTFLILDACMALARSLRWFGRRVRGCGVIYVAAEGHLGLRLQAYLRHHGLSAEDIGDRFRVVDSAVNLLDPRADLPELLEEMNAAARDMGNVGFVVIDTLNRVMPGGDENQADDMGAVIASAKRIEEALGCLVLFVHHCGKNVAAGARGHSSLRAACDVELEVKDSAGLRTMEVTKSRDGESGIQMTFRLNVVDLVPARDLDPEAEEDERITSCVVVTEDESGAARPPMNLSPAARVGLDALTVLAHESGKRLPQTSSIPANAWGVDLAIWKSRFLTMYGEKSDATQQSQDKAYRRVKDELLKAGLIGMSDPWVWRQW